jgi:nicotinamide-nucleotide amidase
MYHTTVADSLEANVEVFRHAAQRADLVIATGGLGPTADDLTRDAIAAVAGVPLEFNAAAMAYIESLFARRKRTMPERNRVQAMFPAGSRVIHNPAGTAPGIDIDIPRPDGSRSRIFALPGVPAEMFEMWEQTVAPAIAALIGKPRVIRHKQIKCFGVGESDLEQMLPDMIRRGRDPQVGITVSGATITLRITASGDTPDACYAAMQPTIDTIHQCLGDLIFGYEEDELENVVARLLREQKKTLLVDEWATCGLISHWLAQCDSADVFKMGFIHTNTDWWRDSGELKTSNVDFHLVVGPAPPPARPGNVVIIVSGAGPNIRKEFPFIGHPEILRPRAAKQALNLLRLHLLGNDP